MAERNADGTLKVIARMRDDWLHEGTDEWRKARSNLMARLRRPVTDEEVEEELRSMGSSESESS